MQALHALLLVDGRGNPLRTSALGALLGITAIAMPSLGVADAGESDIDQLLRLSLEQLSEVQVTTASRHGQSLASVAASVFVLTGETIRASGARSIGEALQLAPNLHVARTDARGFAISARGLRTTLSNKLLVMIDGRPIYTPLFSGVLWDQQDTLLEDIERIEVVSGPGAAAWGSNAVNGVINVITRTAEETVGGLASAHVGESSHGAAVRQGWRAGADGAARLYALRKRFNATENADGGSVGDGWTQAQVGGRSDWRIGDDTLTVQGDAYSAESDARAVGAVEVAGLNLLARWERVRADGSRWHAQGFVDVVDREDPLVLLDRMEMLDLEVQHTRPLGRHLVVAGAGYRRADDMSQPGASARLVPAEETLEWLNVFIEDTFAVSDRLEVDLGLRVEHNSYTGAEFLPSARMAWRASDHALFWASASRAVRAPARFDRALFFPVEEPFLIRGGPGFRAEVAEVVELGYRGQHGDAFNLSATLFHHWHDRLRAGRPADAGGVEIANGVEGRSYGLEAWATWRVASAWELGLGILEVRHDLELSEGFDNSNALRDQGNDPEHQVMLRLTRNLPNEQQLFLHLRHVSSLPDPFVPSYTSLDARWRWAPTPDTEIGLSADNLLGESHVEFPPRAGYAPTVFGRSLSLDFRIDW